MNLRTWENQRGRVSTASGDVSYTDIGEGPVALFVHGVGTNNLLWRKVMAELAGERRCVAPDLPGHGASPVSPEQDLSLNGLARLLEDFCESLELGDVDLVANDTGGAVAQVFAVRHPGRLRTLTLTNCDTQGNLPPEFEFSTGWAHYPSEALEADGLFRLADARQYQSKRGKQP